MSLYTGTVATVEAKPRQANVVTDAPAGSSTLLLDDVGPFREGGGQAFVDGVLLDYLTIIGPDVVEVEPVVNLSTQPSFELDVAGWAAQAGAVAPVRDGARFWTGAFSMRCERGAGTSTLWASRNIGAQVDPNKTYTLQGRLWVPAANPTNGGIRVSGADVAVPATATTLRTTTRDAWAPVTFTFTTNATANTVFFYIDGGTSGQVWVDGIMLNEGSTAKDYGDGSFPGWVWDGTPHASTSRSTGQQAESMTLAAPLAALVSADSTVQVAQQGVGVLDWTANVLLDGQEGLDDDPVPAIIPHELIGYLREGAADAGKVVTLSATARGLYLDELDNGRPLFDGSTLDPGIPIPPEVVPPLPPAPPVAPAESPTPVPAGIPGAIMVRLPPPESANTPTVVDVYMSDTSPVPLDAAHLHGTATAGSLYQVENLPAGVGGAALAYVQADGVTPETYFFVAVARSAEDPSLAATASPEVEGSMRQINSPDVSVSAVWAGWVSAARMTSGTMEAQIVLAGQIESQNPSGPAFGRVGLSQKDGFYSRGVVPAGGTLDDAPVLVHFPTDGAPNLVSGILQADKLTVTGGATFRATTSLETEATLVLEQGVQPPKAAPAYVIGYNKTTHVPVQEVDADRFGLSKGHDGAWVTVRSMDPLDGKDSKLEWYDSAGALVRTVTLPTVSGSRLRGYGVVWTGTRYLVLAFNPDRFASGGLHYYVLALDTAFALTTTNDLGIGAVTSNHTPCIGWDHVNSRALIAYADKGFSPPRIRVDAYTVTTGTLTYLSTWLTPTTYTRDYDMRYVARGTFDYGDGIERTVLRPQPTEATAGAFAVFTTSSNAERTQDEWGPSAGTTRGAWWDGAKFWSVNENYVRTRYQGGRCMWVSGSSRWSFDARYLDTTTTRGITASITSGSKLFSSPNYVFGVGDTGVAISGTGIPAGATIESVTAGTGNAVLSAPATATNATLAATLTSIKHETPPSPRASFTMTKRAQVTLTLTTVPTGRGGVNDADSLRVWWGTGDTDAATTMARERTLAPGVISMSFDGDTAAEGGTAEAAFGNSTPAKLMTAGGGWWLDGKADGDIGTAGFAASVSAKADSRIAATARAGSTAATVSGGDLVISHALGVVPTAVLWSIEVAGGGSRFGVVSAKTATTFTLKLYNASNVVIADGSIVTIAYEVRA